MITRQIRIHGRQMAPLLFNNDITISAVTKIRQSNCVQRVISGTRAPVCSNKVTQSGMCASESKNASRLVASRKNWYPRATDPGMGDQFSAIEHRTIERRHVKLSLGNVHLAGEERVARSVGDFSERYFVSPIACYNAPISDSLRSNNNAGSIARKIIICSDS